MEQNNNVSVFSIKHKDFSIFILLVITFIIMCVASYYYILKPLYIEGNFSTKKSIKDINFTLDTLPATQITSSLPKDIFIEKDVKIISSFTAKSKDGLMTQTTLSYISNKSQAENAKFFADYTSQNNWSFLSRNPLSSEQVYIKDQTVMTISLSLDKTTSKTIVEITIQESTKQ